MDPITAFFFAVFSAIEVGGVGFTATGATIAAYAASFAVVAGSSVMINKALAPSIKDPSGQQSYPFGSQTTQAQGGAILVSYGTNRVEANIVGSYTIIGTAGTVVSNRHVSRNILACFGEGPIETPDDTTIRINGRPLSDLPDVTAEWRLGLVDQTVLTDWTTFRQDYHVGQVCLKDQPVTKTLNRTGFTDLEVHLGFPKGLIHFGTDGDTHPEEVTVKIEVGDAIADTWQTIVEKTISGQTQQPAFVRFLASGTYTGGTPFTVTTGMRPRARVTKTSGDQTNSRHVEDLEFAAVQVYQSVGYTHPGMVLCSLGLVPNEAISGGVTELSVETTGRIISDGDDGFAVSQYAADAIRDILTQPVIEGSGTVPDPWTASYYRGVAASQIVETGFAAQVALSDTQVPDGLGNNVDMLKCDVVFADSTSVHDAVGRIGSSSRCGLRYLGRSFGLWVDSTRTAVGLACDGTYEAGSASLVPIEHDNLAAEASVRYRDADNAYAERSILIVEDEMDTLAEVNIDLAAVTRTHEAARLVRRELARNWLVDLSLACRMDIDAIVYEAGDVLLAQIDGKSLGGRLQAVAAGSVTMERSVTEVVTGDDVIVVQCRNSLTGVQALMYKTVASVSADGLTVTTSGAWTAVDGVSELTPLANDPYLFCPADALDDDQFEVANSEVDDRMYVTLALTRYAAALDDLDALAPDAAIPLGVVERTFTYGGVTRRDLPASAVDQIGTRGDILFEWGKYTFAAGGAGEITWESQLDADGDPSGYVRYGDDLHQPADGSTTHKYVYWDPVNPTEFSTTDDEADVIGKYPIAKNEDGTPNTAFSPLPLSPVAAASIFYRQAAAPANPQVGYIWYDTSTNPTMVKRWDGSIWATIGVDLRGWMSELDPTKMNGQNIQMGTVDATAIHHILAAQIWVDSLSAICAVLGDVVAGSITGATITGSVLRTATSGRRITIDETGVHIEMPGGNGLYGEAGDGGSDLVYGEVGDGGSGFVYGEGVLARIGNTSTGIPFEVVSEQASLADVRLMPRASDPTTGKPGDIALVNHKLRECLTAAPTWGDL